MLINKSRPSQNPSLLLLVHLFLLPSLLALLLRVGDCSAAVNLPPLTESTSVRPTLAEREKAGDEKWRPCIGSVEDRCECRRTVSDWDTGGLEDGGIGGGRDKSGTGGRGGGVGAERGREGRAGARGEGLDGVSGRVEGRSASIGIRVNLILRCCGPVSGGSGTAVGQDNQNPIHTTSPSSPLPILSQLHSLSQNITQPNAMLPSAEKDADASDVAVDAVETVINLKIIGMSSNDSCSERNEKNGDTPLDICSITGIDQSNILHLEITSSTLLANNNMTRFWCFKNLRRLKIILTDNRGKTVTSLNSLRLDWLNISRLVALDLSDGNISSIELTTEVSALGDLTILSLARNNIRNLETIGNTSSTTILQLEKLEHLDLSDNRLVNLPLTFGASSSRKNDDIFQSPPVQSHEKIHALMWLNISGNSLTSLSSRCLSHLKWLRQLDASRNKIAHLDPGVFVGGDRLEFIDLSSNLLSTLVNFTFVDMKSVIMLNLSHNHIDSIEVNAFASCHANPADDVMKGCNNSLLTTVNNVFAVDELTYYCADGRWPALDTLDLSWNSLTTLDEMMFRGVLCGVRTLLVGHNRISHLPRYVVEQLRRLERIDMNNNEIAWLDVGTFTSPTLREINLSSNRLRKIISMTFLYLPAIVSINLNNNEIGYIYKYAFYRICKEEHPHHPHRRQINLALAGNRLQTDGIWKILAIFQHQENSAACELNADARDNQARRLMGDAVEFVRGRIVAGELAEATAVLERTGSRRTNEFDRLKDAQDEGSRMRGENVVQNDGKVRDVVVEDRIQEVTGGNMRGFAESGLAGEETIGLGGVLGGSAGGSLHAGSDWQRFSYWRQMTLNLDGNRLHCDCNLMEELALIIYIIQSSNNNSTTTSKATYNSNSSDIIDNDGNGGSFHADTQTSRKFLTSIGVCYSPDSERRRSVVEYYRTTKNNKACQNRLPPYVKIASPLPSICDVIGTFMNCSSRGINDIWDIERRRRQVVSAHGEQNNITSIDISWNNLTTISLDSHMTSAEAGVLLTRQESSADTTVRNDQLRRLGVIKDENKFRNSLDIANVQQLDLSHSGLRLLEASPKLLVTDGTAPSLALTRLFLHDNRLETLPWQALSSLHELTLRNNPLLCDDAIARCELRRLRHVISDWERVTCREDNGSLIEIINKDDVVNCAGPQIPDRMLAADETMLGGEVVVRAVAKFHATVVLVAVAILVSLAIIVVRRQGRRSRNVTRKIEKFEKDGGGSCLRRYWKQQQKEVSQRSVYESGSAAGCRNELLVYDAFVSYCEADEAFVTGSLLEVIWTLFPRYSLCLQQHVDELQRDDVRAATGRDGRQPFERAGTGCGSTIGDFIENSQITLVVLSKGFIESFLEIGSGYEPDEEIGGRRYRGNLVEKLDSQRHRFLFLISDDSVLSDLDACDPELSGYVRENLRLNITDTDFVSQLCTNLPYPLIGQGGGGESERGRGRGERGARSCWMGKGNIPSPSTGDRTSSSRTTDSEQGLLLNIDEISVLNDTSLNRRVSERY